MSLKEDINAALTEMKHLYNLPDLTLDELGRCQISANIPAEIVELAEGRLIIEVEVSPTGKFFSFYTPIAIVTGRPSSEFLEALFYRQFYAEQLSSASFAIAAINEYDVLVSIYHWMLDTISPTQFAQLYQKFVLASFKLMDEVKGMLPYEPNNIELIHP